MTTPTTRTPVIAWVIAWATPPEPRKPGRMVSRHQPLLEALQGNPGEWALIYQDVPRGYSKWFTDQGCEVKTRRTSDAYASANADIYARYIEDVNA